MYAHNIQHTVPIISDELKELYQMRDATRLKVKQVMNIDPGVRARTVVVTC